MRHLGWCTSLTAECLGARFFSPATSSLQAGLLALHAWDDLFIYLGGTASKDFG